MSFCFLSVTRKEGVDSVTPQYSHFAILTANKSDWVGEPEVNSFGQITYCDEMPLGQRAGVCRCYHSGGLGNCRAIAVYAMADRNHQDSKGGNARCVAFLASRRGRLRIS